MNSVAKYIPFLLEHVNDLKAQKVLIIGDIGVDEYVLGDVHRISPEAPVPVVDVRSEEARLGLSGNVAQNIASLGGTPILIAVVGKDAAAEQLRELLRRAKVSPDSLIVDSTRPTTRKLRVMVQNHHIVRVDYEQKKFLEASLEAKILDQVKANIKDVSAVIVQDYAKGVISQGLVQEVVKIAKAANKKILVDPHRTTPLDYYRGVDVMTPNFEEAIALSGESADDLRVDVDHLNRIGRKLMEGIHSTKMVITRGKNGMRIIEDGKATDIPTFARQVFDVTGAGDTVIAALALGWGSGFSLEQACALGNFAAGVVVGKVGCVPCATDELVAYMQAHAQESGGALN